MREKNKEQNYIYISIILKMIAHYHLIQICDSTALLRSLGSPIVID